MWERMSSLYSKYDKHEKCQHALAQAVEIRKKYLADDAPEMIGTKELLAESFLRQGMSRGVEIYIV